MRRRSTAWTRASAASSPRSRRPASSTTRWSSSSPTTAPAPRTFREDVTIDELVDKLMIARRTRAAASRCTSATTPTRMPGPENTYQSYGTGLGQPVEHAVPPLQALDPRGRHLDAADRPLAERHRRARARSATRRATCPTSWRRSSTSPARPIRDACEGQPIEPLEGQSLLPVFARDGVERPPMFWEHEGNAAVRIGKWKLVRSYPRAWELYDMDADRTELHDLAAAASRARRRHGGAVRGLGEALRRARRARRSSR